MNIWLWYRAIPSLVLARTQKHIKFLSESLGSANHLAEDLEGVLDSLPLYSPFLSPAFWWAGNEETKSMPTVQMPQEGSPSVILPQQCQALPAELQ